jgi:hypothetical protein
VRDEMKVYIVTQSWGIYSDYTEVVIGVVSSMEKAKELALNAEPVSWEDSTVEVECFELDGERKSFSKAEREAYKSTDDFYSKDRIILNELDEAGI